MPITSGVHRQCALPDRCHRDRRNFVLRGRSAKSKQHLLIVLLWVICGVPLSAQAPPIEPPEEQPLPRPEEGAPPVKGFPKDLVRNFGAVFAKDNIVPLLVGAAATGAAIPADDPLTDFFRNGSRWRGFDDLGKQLGKSQLLGPAIGVSFLVSRATDNRDFQRFTYSLAQGFIVTNTITGGLKVIAGRERP